MFVCMVITYSKGKDQPGKVANPARGQLNRENELFPFPVYSIQRLFSIGPAPINHFACVCCFATCTHIQRRLMYIP